MKKMNEMNLTESQVHRILVERPEMNKLSFTMLVSRLGRKYKTNYDQSFLTECTKEINKFLKKYKRAMSEDYMALRENYGDEILIA